MEWKMVWKDVTIGFTVAGIIASFVPQVFFESLFVGSGMASDPGFLDLLLQAAVGPIAAFFTFIGSMGNIPLAAVLFSNGVSFVGVMAFIFSDLVVFPVLRIQAKYYGWKMALYILGMFLVILILTSLIMHYGFSFAGMLPEASLVGDINERDFFKVDYTFFLNLFFLFVSGVSLYFFLRDKGHSMGGSKKLSENILFYLSFVCYTWLVGGMLVYLTS